MLKEKDISAPSGAEHLAGMMVNYTRDMNVHAIWLEDLRDAPAEWNFFRPLPDNKFCELLASIEENGLLVPLIVWESDEGGYIILSGHNRKRALSLLYQRTGDAAYRSAPCVVYHANMLTEDEARAILIDCNWVQRSLSTTEKARAIYTKYVSLGRRPRGMGGRRYEDVAGHFGIKATQVYHYYKLAQLDPFWLDQVDTGALSIKAAVHLCSLSESQQALLRQHPGLTQKQILSIDRCFSDEEILRALNRVEIPMRELHVLVPEDRYEEIRKVIEAMLSDDERDDPVR